MLAGIRRTSRPKGYDAVRDHNTGVDESRNLATYLKRRGARGFFKCLTSSVEVISLIEEHAAAVQAWHDERGTADRTGYDRMMEMRTPAFARARAAELHHLLEERR
jgi:hypothetical protein